MSMIVEKLLAHDHCSDIFQLPTGKCKGHDADENIFQLLVGKCGGGYTGSDKPIADFFARITARSVYFAERMAERLLGIEDREIFSFWYTYNKGKQGDTMNKPKNYCQVVKRSLP